MYQTTYHRASSVDEAVSLFGKSSEAKFLAAVRAAGLVPVRLGVLPESHGKFVLQDGWKPVVRIRTEPNRLVYTIAGDFPVPGPIRRD